MTCIDDGCWNVHLGKIGWPFQLGWKNHEGFLSYSRCLDLGFHCIWWAIWRDTRCRSQSPWTLSTCWLRSLVFCAVPSTLRGWQGGRSEAGCLHELWKHKMYHTTEKKSRICTFLMNSPGFVGQKMRVLLINVGVVLFFRFHFANTREEHSHQENLKISDKV